MIRLLITLLMILPVFAWAACWEEIVETTDGDRIFLDKCSVAIDGKYKKAWTKWENKEEKNIEEDYLPKKMADSSKSLYYFDCAKRQSSIAQAINYNHDEVVKSSSINVKKMYFDEVVPDSIGEAILEAACGKIKKTKTDGLIRDIFYLKDLLIYDIRKNDKDCWSLLYKKNNYDAYFSSCFTEATNVIESIGDKKGINLSNLRKGAIKFKFNKERKIITSNSDKVYYDSYISNIYIDCSNNAKIFKNKNFYLNGKYQASSVFGGDISDFIDVIQNMHNNILCDNNDKEAEPAPAPSPENSEITEEQNAISHNLKGTRKVDAMPTSFCWEDAYSDSTIDVYYSKCNIGNENGYKKAWIKIVLADDEKIEGSYLLFDEVIQEVYVDCTKNIIASLQKYFIYPDIKGNVNANNIIHTKIIKDFKDIEFIDSSNLIIKSTIDAVCK